LRRVRRTTLSADPPDIRLSTQGGFRGIDQAHDM
jgi:hypothetical protein